MTEMQAWIAVCHLQDREGNPAQDYVCQVAVRTDSYDSFRTQLSTYLETTPYRLLWIEECHPALKYIRRHGQQHRIGNLARTVHPGHPVELGPLSAKGDDDTAPETALSFRDALLALDHKTAPVFAVLDGAQFDNLPKALFDGDFISRPLYLDRGDNNPEQIITAPHMVTLDELAEKDRGRSYKDTVVALLDLTGDKPAAIFWQCPKGAEVLYKHLRGINTVILPKSSLTMDEQAFVEKDRTPALFRHSDANVLAQVLAGLSSIEMARFFGPARRLMFAPDDIWRQRRDYVTIDWLETWPIPRGGMLELADTTIDRIEKVRENGLKKWAVRDFSSSDDPEDTQQVENAFDRAQFYGLENKGDIWDFIELDCRYGAGFEKYPAYQVVYNELSDTANTSGARIYYARQICEKLGGR